ncbi:MAG TPA: PEGA domain-containing protein, partial [Nannocystaceae bacterium]|nr:PEGA domain-containing protein [Nannocystaceae bacterium]
PDSGKAIPLSTASTGSVQIQPAPVAQVRAAVARASGVDRKSLFIVLGLGGVALTLVVVLVFGGLGGDNKPTETTTTPTTAPVGDGGGSTAKSYPFNRALVRTNIAGAKVLVDGVEQCETPCEIKVPVGDDISHEIRLKKEGFVDVVQNWRPRNVGDPLPALPDMKKI